MPKLGLVAVGTQYPKVPRNSPVGSVQPRTTRGHGAQRRSPGPGGFVSVNGPNLTIRSLMWTISRVRLGRTIAATIPAIIATPPMLKTLAHGTQAGSATE